MTIPKAYVRRYWFGVDDAGGVADIVLLMERDRLEQYQGALDFTLNRFQGVFSGLTGIYNGKKISIVYSISPAHIADCVNFLTYAFDVQHIISTGSVGGLAAEMGDIVISNTCTTQDTFSCSVYPDEVRYEPSLGYLVGIKMPQSLVISETISSKVREAFNCNILLGPIFTVPAVSLENSEQLNQIKSSGHIALDLETGPFLAACSRSGTQGFCVHWVTDLPLERSFYYQYAGDPKLIEQDKAKKHSQWLNMPHLILPIVDSLINK